MPRYTRFWAVMGLHFNGVNTSSCIPASMAKAASAANVSLFTVSGRGTGPSTMAPPGIVYLTGQVKFNVLVELHARHKSSLLDMDEDWTTDNPSQASCLSRHSTFCRLLQLIRSA